MQYLRIIRWIVIGPAVFLSLDGVLAILLGKPYMLWGLEYTPEGYHALIESVAELPPATLLGIKLGEVVVGSILFWLGRRISLRQTA